MASEFAISIDVGCVGVVSSDERERIIDAHLAPVREALILGRHMIPDRSDTAGRMDDTIASLDPEQEKADAVNMG